MSDLQQRKAELHDYFNGLGFSRWSSIYGDGELSTVRRAIREGHAQMLAQACAWLEPLPRGSALDAGCGTGMLTLELAKRGFAVTAIDLAPQMASATAEAAAAAGLAERVTAYASDLEQVQGRFDLVACFDVLIHYPRSGFGQLCRHLAGLSSDRLFLTYAPHSPLLAALHRLSKLFPSGQRHTNIQMLRHSEVQHELAQAGFEIVRTAPISHRFYHVTLLEARRSAPTKTA